MDVFQMRVGIMQDASRRHEDPETRAVKSSIPKGLEVRVVTPFTPFSPFAEAPALGFSPNPHAQRPFSELSDDSLGRAATAYQYRTSIVQRTELRVKFFLRALLVLLVASILWTLQRARRFWR